MRFKKKRKKKKR